MTDLIFLGTGAITPERPGDHTAMLIKHGPARILLDAGPAVMMQLDRVGVSPDQITHIYLSHHHGDHILGSPIFLFYHRMRYLMGAQPTLEGWLMLMETVYPGYLPKVADELAFLFLEEGMRESVPAADDISISQVQTQHAPELPAYAARFDFASTDTSPAFSVVYSGDTTPTAAVVNLARDADLLIHEATAAETLGMSGWGVHTTAREAGRIAAEAGVKALALVHRMPGPAEIWVQEAGERFSGQIFAPRAGDRLQLPQELL
jgi:ribonuclease Z